MSLQRNIFVSARKKHCSTSVRAMQGEMRGKLYLLPLGHKSELCDSISVVMIDELDLSVTTE